MADKKNVETAAVNKIEFDYKGRHYCLEYNRDSVVRMENAGYKPGETEMTPAIELNMLWAGAFAKNHLTGANRVSNRVIEETLNEVTMDKLELREVLRGMVAETYTSMMSENDQGNVKLTIL